MIVYCADIGSIKQNRFGWARVDTTSTSPDAETIGQRPDKLVELVAADLSNERVALGFECPLFIPLRAEPADMMKARRGEGNRAWSAGAGLTVMTLGLVQVAWVLERVAARLESQILAFVDWAAFSSSPRGLFVWEAFVSAGGKYRGNLDPHAQDALIAVRRFVAALPDPTTSNAIDEPVVYSLAGAALLRSGMSRDPDLVSQPTLVIR